MLNVQLITRFSISLFGAKMEKLLEEAVLKSL